MPFAKFTPWFLVVGLSLLFSISTWSSTDSPIGLHKGVFLVATANLHGTSFEKTVILITEHGANGAMGLAINRPTTLSLAEVVPELKDLAQVRAAHIYLGGPVHPMAIVFLTRATTTPEGGVHVFEDVYIGAGMPGLKSALTTPPPSDAGKTVQTYSGYAGWMPQQLENEIARGDWIVIMADPAAIFDADIETIWQQLSRKWSGKWI